MKDTMTSLIRHNNEQLRRVCDEGLLSYDFYTKSRRDRAGASGLIGRKVLVTAGAGFIGSHLVPQLLLEGMKVAVVDNLSTWPTASPISLRLYDMVRAFWSGYRKYPTFDQVPPLTDFVTITTRERIIEDEYDWRPVERRG